MQGNGDDCRERSELTDIEPRDRHQRSHWLLQSDRYAYARAITINTTALEQTSFSNAIRPTRRQPSWISVPEAPKGMCNSYLPSILTRSSPPLHVLSYSYNLDAKLLSLTRRRHYTPVLGKFVSQLNFAPITTYIYIDDKQININYIFLCIFVQGRSQPTQSKLIQICSVDWTDVYDKHNIEHRPEPVSHQSISGQLILPQR